jgi:hypothetical protein
VSISLKLRVVPRFLASIFDGVGTKVRKDGLASYIDLDFLSLTPLTPVDPATAILAVYDQTAGVYKSMTAASLISSASAVVQDITTGGPANVQANAGVVLVRQAVGAPITLTMPISSAKTTPVLISDFKGDSGTNNITINLTAPDKFPGGLSSWKIAGDGGSLYLRPVSGIGYTL